MPTKKNIKTEAEKSGIASVADKVKEIKQVIDSAVQTEKPKKKRVITEEQKAVLRERLEWARAVKKEKQAQKATNK